MSIFAIIKYIKERGGTFILSSDSHSKETLAYEFDRWDDGDTINPRQVFVVSDTSFTALFRMVEDTTQAITQSSIQAITIYPNPSHGEVTIVVNQPSTVSVTDLVGREIVPPTAVNDRLSMANLPAGVYLLRVSTDGATTVKKLLVE